VVILVLVLLLLLVVLLVVGLRLRGGVANLLWRRLVLGVEVLLLLELHLRGIAASAAAHVSAEAISRRRGRCTEAWVCDKLLMLRVAVQLNRCVSSHGRRGR